MDRIMGVLTLRAPAYREIADDPNATTPAAIIVAVVSFLTGLLQGFVMVAPDGSVITGQVVNTIVSAIIITIFGLIAWAFSAWVLAFVARWFGGKTNTKEMLRVTGFVHIFGLVSVALVLVIFLPVLACLVAIIGLVAAIFRLIGYIVGVREAAEFSTGNAIVTAIVAIIVQFVILFAGGLVVAAVAGMFAQ
jgi:hypothetical protein